jgi:uncharacterized protein (DUF2252 family)
MSRQDLRDRGTAIRKEVPRSSHAGWAPPPDRRDPLAILDESNATRLPELVPVRYGRMLTDPFSFFRGAPAVMAHDLARTPTTSIRPQICGDAHIANFGLFATPERRLTFDVNDFDETLPGPFEWDIKRLAASIAVAARTSGSPDATARNIVRDAARAYARRSRELAELTTLDIWNLQTDVEAQLTRLPDREARKVLADVAGKARTRTHLRTLSKLTTVIEGQRVIVDDPPLVVRLQYQDEIDAGREFFENYASTLQPERRHLLRQYRLVDLARKVVGVGSVGTRCYVALGAGRADLDPLLLQIKEAQASVLEPFLGRSEQINHGERVVVGQRLMQAASDIFLGWTQGPAGFEFFVRQLRDMKGSVDIAGMTPSLLDNYAVSCARTLARAHARSLDPALVSGYLGSGERFAEAVAEFAIAYAGQTVHDHAQLVEAVHDGRIDAHVGR